MIVDVFLELFSQTANAPEHFSLFRSGPKPWSELLAADMDTENWVRFLCPCPEKTTPKIW